MKSICYFTTHPSNILYICTHTKSHDNPVKIMGDRAWWGLRRRAIDDRHKSDIAIAIRRPAWISSAGSGHGICGGWGRCVQEWNVKTRTSPDPRVSEWVSGVRINEDRDRCAHNEAKTLRTTSVRDMAYREYTKAVLKDIYTYAIVDIQSHML